ncbi:MAG: (2Fe-2S)-binding protein [Acetobacteraceae bacterium]|nr:(2Fe-2S)-binding protein [Acetobacteraceae bacterium]
MFRRTAPTDCTIVWDGRAVPARAGESLAAALLAAGIPAFRETAVSGSARGPLCLMGACYDCLVEVDGRANVQACLETVRDGLRAEPMRGARTARLPA